MQSVTDGPDGRTSVSSAGRSTGEPGPGVGDAVDIRGLSKRFGATQALVDVGFSIPTGEVRGLIGENGAGKSTLLKVMSGLVRPDEGEITIMGRSYRPRTPLDAQHAGVQTAFQELTLVEDLTVTQNLLLPHEPQSRFGLVDRRASWRRAEQILADYGVHDVDFTREVRDLSLADRQRIEIVRSVSRGPRILLLDEATSALSNRDVEWLYTLVRRLSGEGVVVVFISHRIPEIRHLCASISILRNGRHIVTQATATVSDAEIVHLVIGRSLVNAFPPKPDKGPVDRLGAPSLSVRNLGSGALLQNVSFDLKPGRIMGLAALDGMGQAELFATLFGARLADRGTISIDGQVVAFSSPLDAAKAGLGYVPSDRRKEGVLLALSGTVNMALTVLDTYAPLSLVRTGRLKADISRLLALFKIHPRALYCRAGSFSGGNQQKFVLAKWLLAGVPILLLNDPTRGVDVGTKFEIFSMMRRFVDGGGAILFYSTELSEITHMCDDVIVMYRGSISDRFMGPEMSEEALMSSVLGQARGGDHRVD